MMLDDNLKGMVKYQFQADDDVWNEWKNTVPRTKSLETRINELIVADTEGRVVEKEENDDADEQKEE